ncbi:proton-conducting transporter membrane subunit [Desulfobacter postgatei]|jgi:hydrogenase-4 component B|uniref:proton-conducting transporter transmembrane domain-containing protein n=1 Tax=Desulfobacter postgatei TaxID=2293 RepID=UPI002A36B14C|nr:proton-conducting transporter membrane subunit [Desulfobacter postgatei]MDX9963562.1 proton-conducting transporter membrane subunit [Desulfobacter postgatei]
MCQFFSSTLIILLGGFLALVFARQKKFSKGIAVLFLSGGSLLGLIDAADKLLNATGASASFKYLDLFSLSFHVDGLSAFFLTAIFAVSMMAAIYSFHYMESEAGGIKTGVNYFFFSILISSMALVVTAANIITFMISWEIMSLSSFFLVIYGHESAENRKAGYLYFVFSHVGAMFILAAFGLIYGHTGSFDFASMADVPETIKIVIFVLSFIGFGSKAGVFPFHIWLPHAHPAAPSHISAVMSGVMIKTGIYGILRVYAILDFHSPVFGYITLIAGVVSGILGVVYALGQHDIKRLLAYSSMENIGIILIGLGIGMIGAATGNPLVAVLGFAGGILHVLNHSLFKSLLFMGAGMVLHQTGTRSIDALGGLLKGMKITGSTFIIASLAICGLPPFNGFVSEFLIYMGSFKGIPLGSISFAMSVFAIISLAVIGGLALACFTKVVGVVFQGEPRTKAAENAKENGLAMMIPMGVLAAACVIIGVFPRVFIQMALTAVQALGLDYARVPVEPFGQITGNITFAALLFFVIVLIVMGIRSIYYKNKTTPTSGTWGCGFTQPTVKMQYTGSSYARSILEFFSAAAPLSEDHPRIKGRFPLKTHYHSHVNDIAELHMKNAVVRPVFYLFDKLRWMQHGDIHLYIGYILLAIVLLLFFI